MLYYIFRLFPNVLYSFSILNDQLKSYIVSNFYIIVKFIDTTTHLTMVKELNKDKNSK